MKHRGPDTRLLIGQSGIDWMCWRELNAAVPAPNKITGPNAGGSHQLPMLTRWATRVAQFWRSLI